MTASRLRDRFCKEIRNKVTYAIINNKNFISELLS